MPNAAPALRNDTGPSSEGPDGPRAKSTVSTTATPSTPAVTMAVETPELDDFGLPIRKYQPPLQPGPSTDNGRVKKLNDDVSTAKATRADQSTGKPPSGSEGRTGIAAPGAQAEERGGGGTGLNIGKDAEDEDEFKDALSSPRPDAAVREHERESGQGEETPVSAHSRPANSSDRPEQQSPETNDEPSLTEPEGSRQHESKAATTPQSGPPATGNTEATAVPDAEKEHSEEDGTRASRAEMDNGATGVGMSEFSHQQLTAHLSEQNEDDDDGWQEMPAYAPYNIYDDDNKLIAKEHDEAADETYGYAGLGGAGKGYTRVLLDDDDAESANSLDDNTQYLFKGAGSTSMLADEEMQRDAVSQLEATKDLLTEGQRIAYVGLTRLEMSAMLAETEAIPLTRRTKKEVQLATESMRMWSQKMMIRLYSHMDISQAEQVMIEQLADHGVMPRDLTPLLMANARVKNPMAGKEEESKRTSVAGGVKSPRSPSRLSRDEEAAEPPPPPPPPPYEPRDNSELAEPVRMPSQLPTSQKIDIDLRWTVLCDLFLVLIADSVYDSRSRVLLERVGKDLDIEWMDICRFEKKVTDALEMQQNAEKENWNEEEHMENRRKAALKRRYVMMGLATVGGGLVIGLSAGLLAPMIGAGLAAGFATIGVGGTSGFLAGAGGAAIITSSAAASGSIIGVKAANRRTGAVKTFEYRPLHNNKRVNLIVTVSGWMTGKVDDVRLPYSTVDPIMGDIYSVLWEPEMLTSMGDTINILATEALTQGLQQLLGSTILVSLMAALQLPVVLTKLAYLIDNPWAVSLDRATMAGLILADSLIDRNLGTRPITLVGYSLGSRVIFSCLQELARKGAFGIIQNVFIFGSPIVVRQDEYLRARAVVSGRFVNGYNRNDWILGYLFRLTNGGIRRVAGLAPVEGVPRLENFDASDFVVGHMDYRMAMPRLLRENGWLVESDEFTEIEDPDPDNHQERQRELIGEIEEARKELDKELEQEAKAGGGSSKGRFGFFRKRKEKQEWEVYEATSGKAGGNGAGAGTTEDTEGNNHGVLFDVDAIRAELAREREEEQAKGVAEQADDDEMLRLQVREIKSTLPPMKLDIGPTQLAPPARSRANTFRESKSAESLRYRSSLSSFDTRLPLSPAAHEYRLSAEDIPAGGWLGHSSKPSRSDDFYYPGHGSGGDDEVHMTFDTSFEDSGHHHKPHYADATPPPPPPKDDLPPYATAAPSALPRPEFRTAQTVPNITLQDPWADEDEDEDFGKEKELELTFA